MAKAELEGPALPEGCLHVWTWFLELNQARKSGEPVGFGEIADWARLTGRFPTPREVHWLRALDGVWLAGGAEPEEGGDGADGQRQA